MVSSDFYSNPGIEGRYKRVSIFNAYEILYLMCITNEWQAFGTWRKP